MDACRKLWRNLLLHIVPQHGKDLLHKSIQLLLEQQGWILGLNLHQCNIQALAKVHHLLKHYRLLVDLLKLFYLGISDIIV